MVSLPLFKLATLFVRHISKYGANRIKTQAHDHPRFRAFAARHGQHIHQLNMRLQVAMLRNSDAEAKAREKAEKAEASTIKAKEQVEREAEIKEQRSKPSSKTSPPTPPASPLPPASQSPPQTPSATSESPPATSSTSTSPMASQSTHHPFSSSQKPQSVWKRKFRPLPETKAVDLFADVVGDGFILAVAAALIVFEYWRTSTKPDHNLQRIHALENEIEALRERDRELREREEGHRQRLENLEAALRELRDPKTRIPLVPALQDR